MNIRRLGLGLVHSLCFLALLHAAHGATPTKPAASTAKHTLWRVQGTNATVYLLGSVHFLRETNYPLPAAITNAFHKAEIVAFETDIGKMEDPATLQEMSKKATLPPGESLKKQLSEETYTAFSNRLAKAELATFMFDQLRPGMAAMFLTVMELQRLGFNPEFGLDKHFYELAMKSKKEILPLETLEFQLDLFTAITEKEGEQLLKATLKDLDEMGSMFDDIVAAWETGQGDKLAKLINKAMEESPELYKRMLTDRNANWVSQITKLIEGKKDAIVIVGAGHLVGKQSVVELLEKRGFKVVQE